MFAVVKKKTNKTSQYMLTLFGAVDQIQGITSYYHTE